MKSTKTHLAILLLALLMGLGLWVLQVGCSPSVESRNQVRLAIIGDVISKMDDKTLLFFLSFDETHEDPDSEFLSRIQRIYPQVRKGSSAGDVPPYLERGTNKPGIVLWIGDLSVGPFNSAEASMKMMVGPMDGGGSVFELKRVDGQWVVMMVKSTWVS